MGRSIERRVENGVETQRRNDSGSKTPKMDKIKQDTQKKISDNFKKR
jgi:hypothetical protein